MQRTIVTADIGGTHARFAIAQLGGGADIRISDPVTLRTAEFESFEDAWRRFEAETGPLPDQLAVAFAGPVEGDVLKLTNSRWTIQRDALRAALRLERLVVVNDFGAIAHAAARLGADAFRSICGPDLPLPQDGVVAVLGPGTGLGVSAVLLHGDRYDVIETEGGHIAFAPADDVEEAVLRRLRQRFGRVSLERLVSGSGLLNIYEALAAVDGRPPEFADDRALWTAALSDSDVAARAALDRFCLILGAVAGDFALAFGAGAVVVAGGLGLRLEEHLPSSGFAERFVAKGRFRPRMEGVAAKLLVHPQPGLYGAAAALAQTGR